MVLFGQCQAMCSLVLGDVRHGEVSVRSRIVSCSKGNVELGFVR